MGKVMDQITDMLGLSTIEETVEENNGEVVEEGDVTTEESEEVVDETVEETAEEVVEDEEQVLDDGEVVEDQTIEEVVDEDIVEESINYQEQNAALLARIQELEGQPKIVTQDKEPETEDKISFLGDDADIDEVLNNKDKLNNLLVQVYKKAITDASGQFNGIAPGMVIDQVEKHLTLKSGIDEFFAVNNDLLAVRKTVGAITNEIVGEHPDWTLKQVLTESGERTRKVLSMPKQTKQSRKRNPALVSKGSSRQNVTDKRTVMQKEIDDII